MCATSIPQRCHPRAQVWKPTMEKAREIRPSARMPVPAPPVRRARRLSFTGPGHNFWREFLDKELQKEIQEAELPHGKPGEGEPSETTPGELSERTFSLREWSQKWSNFHWYLGNMMIRCLVLSRFSNIDEAHSVNVGVLGNADATFFGVASWKKMHVGEDGLLCRRPDMTGPHQLCMAVWKATDIDLRKAPILASLSD